MVSSIVWGVLIVFIVTIITALIIIGIITNNHKHLKKAHLKLNFYGCSCHISIEEGTQD